MNIAASSGYKAISAGWTFVPTGGSPDAVGCELYALRPAGYRYDTTMPTAWYLKLKVPADGSVIGYVLCVSDDEI
jgi:hypothetical protein